jgi:hypothetical protein
MSTSRKTLLAGVSAAAFTLVIGGAALAADVTVPTTSGTTSTVDGHIALNDLLTNTNSSSSATESTSGAAGAVTGSGNSVTVNTNALGAVTIGNSIVDTVDFDTTSNGSGNGIGILSMGLNTSRAFTATTSGSFDTNAINGGATGTYQVDDNTTEASTTLNTSTVTVTSTGVPLNFASANTGTISTQYPGGNIIATTGDVTAVNSQGNQTSIDTTSQSLLSDNTASLSVGQLGTVSTTLQPIGGSEDISGNSLSASFTGNQATTAVGATSGDLPKLTGSLTVANVQANYETGAGATGGQADATGNTVTATISGNANSTGSNATEELTGTLTENSNSISASTTGNSASATSGTTTSGNTITLTGVDYANPGAQTEANTIDYPGIGIATATNGGLALLNSQTEETTTGTSTLASTNTGSDISSTVQNAAAATSELNTNSITSSAIGDTAFNAISVSGVGTDTINGSATLGSAQEANHLLLSATTTDGSVGSFVGDAAAANDIVTGTTAQVDTNTISATAYGASVTNSISLGASSVTTGTSTSTLTATRANLASGDFDASNTGATINNVQTVFGSNSTVTADNASPYVDLRVGGNTDALTGDTFQVTGNTLEAIAAGTSGGSAITVGGATGGQAATFSGGLGVLNGQGNEAAVTATLSNSAADLLAGYGGGGGANVGAAGAGSSLSDSSNILRALAYGNQAVGDTASVDAGTITVAADTVDSSSITVNTADALGLLFDNGSTPTVNGGVAVFNDQADTNNVEASATTIGNVVHILAGGSVVDSQATADSNAFLSAARGNAATNGATLTGNIITTVGGASGPVASVANVQELGTDVTVSSTTDSSSNGTPGGTADPTIYVDILGNLNGLPATPLTGSSADASSNTIEALTVGNTSTNSLSATAGSSITASIAGPASTTGATYGGGALTNDAAFSVTNAQGSGAGGARDATLSNLGVHIDVGGNAVGALATADTNDVIASATDNDATSSLTLDPASIQATATVQNLQLSNASLDVTQGKAGTAGTPGTPGITTPVLNFTTTLGATATDSGFTLTVNTHAIDFDISGFSPSDISALQTALGGGTVVGTELVLAPGTYTTTQSDLLGSGPIILNTETGGTFGAITINGIPATAATPGTGIVITVANAITSSTINNDNNAFSGSAIGNNATNTLSVTAGNAANAAGAVPIATQGALEASGVDTATGDFALQNEQTKSNTISATSNATDSIIDTATHTGAVDNTTGSTLTLNGNSNQAVGQGNLATNTVSVAVTNSTGVTASLLSNQSSSSATNSATANQTVSSNLLVANSTVSESTNSNLALATNNTATNSLSAGAGGASLGSGYGGPANGGAEAGAIVGTEVGASADYAVNNIQTDFNNTSTVSSLATLTVGNSDVAPTTTGAGSISGSNILLNANTNAAQSTVNQSTNSLTLDPSASLAADGAVTNYQTSLANSTAGAGAAVTLTEPNAQGSTIDISSNKSTADALGNVSTSTLNASAGEIALTTVVGALAALDPGTTLDAPVTGAQGASADYALFNDQGATGGAASTALGVFSVLETVPTSTSTVETTGSALTLDNNLVEAASEANMTTNTLTIAASSDATSGGGAHAPTGALLSEQTVITGASPITSSSTADISATGMVSSSTVDMSTNTNLALSVANDAINTLNASATNYGSGGNTTLGNNLAKANTTGVSADLAVQNVQNTSGTTGLTSMASTTIDQSDTTATTGITASVANSTVTIDDNTTTADSTVNRANNSITLGAVNTGALAGVSSTQNSSVSSSATTTATIGYAEPNATTSTVALNGNTSTAQATGNSATNALDASASANYTIPAGSSGSTNNATPTAWGQYAVLNDQSNTGAINAQNTSTVTLALNGGTAGPPSVVNSTLSASNNTIQALATGNAATNSIALSADVTGTAPVGLSSIQSNTLVGTSISATVTGSFAGVSAGAVGGTSGSTIAVNANTMVARSTGNSVVNTITAK